MVPPPGKTANLNGLKLETNRNRVTTARSVAAKIKAASCNLGFVLGIEVIAAVVCGLFLSGSTSSLLFSFLFYGSFSGQEYVTRGWIWLMDP